MASDIPQRIHRLFGMLILAFVALIVWQSYWHLAKSEWLLSRQSNRRLARAERIVPRGVIYDRHGTRLAWTENGTRKYADSRATAIVLGYLDPRIGRTGVEGEWDLELAGLSRTFTADDYHRLLAREKAVGKDLTLTLDFALQRAALRALHGRKGAVVALDPATGEILALASSPTFDAATIGTDFATLRTSQNGELRNRATQDIYPPGSTMKVVTAAAALMHGIDPRTTYTCQGKTKFSGITITDYHGHTHGTVAMEQALAQSCNLYYARTAATLGFGPLSETARSFGFGRDWREALPDTRMFPIGWSASSLASAQTHHAPLGELAQMGFGQATVVATPLQMAMVAAGVANRGTVMAPYLVTGVRKGGTHLQLASFTSTSIGDPLDGNTARQVAAMMRRVVSGGTATGANVSGLTVYGKTGTAQQVGGGDHAWFIGFAERQQGTEITRIAFAVLIERGGTGGRVAVPVARQLLEAWAKS